MKRRRVFIAVLAVLALIFAPAPLAADEHERVRFGLVPQGTEIPGDGDEIGTTTPTLVIDDPVTGAEIVVHDADGTGVAASGPLSGDRWIVPEGVLSPGGTYHWKVTAPTGATVGGTSQPEIQEQAEDLHVLGEMVIGSQSVDYTVVQGERSFSIETGIGPSAGAAGLYTAFFPHYDVESQITFDDDGNPVEELPSEIVPSPESHMVTETGTWELDQSHAGFCIKEERAQKPPAGQFPPPPLEFQPTAWILCDVRYGVDAHATVIEDGGHAAAHNVVGTNVAPSYGTTITEDLAIADGFVISTGGQQTISGSFPLQTEFGFRSLGYLQVPETGTYRFGTQSPGGAELVLYDTTDADLGEIVVSVEDAWWPTTLGEEYEASTEHWRFVNERTGTSTDQDWNYYYRTHHYQYDEDDTDWFQAEESQVRSLLDRLRDSGPRADEVRWGPEVTLEAGTVYPIAFTGWAGPIGGDIGINVDGPGSGPMPVPFDWLTSAGDDIVGFDRGMDASAVAPIDGVDFAISGHGDTLAVLGADGSLGFYETDGGVGWKHVNSVPHLGLPQPFVWEHAAGAQGMAFDDAGATLAVVADRWPDPDRVVGDPTFESYAGAFTTDDLFGWVVDSSGDAVFLTDGPFTTLQDPFWLEIRRFSNVREFTLEVEALSLTVDPSGEIVDASLTGTLELDGDTWQLATVGGGSVDDYLTLEDIRAERYNQELHFDLLMEHVGSEPGPPRGDLAPLEVAIVDKIDPSAPWSVTNQEIRYVSSVLDEAGVEQPWLDPDNGGDQVVALTPDGNTLVVQQPVGADQRVVVIDRNHADAPWRVAGTFDSASGAIAVGRDGDDRFVALADGSVVTVHTWTPSGGWAVADVLNVDGTVASLALDYFGEHLAVGQGDIGRVTVFQRPPWATAWTHQIDLDGPASFGEIVEYDWGLLTVADVGESLVRVYRNTGFQPWSSYSDWSQTYVDGEGDLLMFDTGGNAVRFRVVTAVVDAGHAFAGLPTHVG